MGDLNIDLLSDDSHSRELQSLISSYACINYITLPTRITCNTAALLDIGISNAQLPHTESGLLSLDIGDHLPIFCFIPLRLNRVTNTVTHMTRDFNDVALNEFRKLIEDTNCESIYEISEVNTAYSEFIDIFLTQYNAAFPQIERNINLKKFKKPWMNKSLYARVTKKNYMYHEFLHSRDLALLFQFKQFRNKLNKDFKNAKSNYYISHFSQIQNDSR